ncbi:MAG TPA: response regulator, partial [Desulfobacteraceae bacterium]|nr:response regulator [Desulfobacteraceae bacterium]
MVKIPTRILIVDDEKDFVEMLSLRLKEMGEKVESAY